MCVCVYDSYVYVYVYVYGMLLDAKYKGFKDADVGEQKVRKSKAQIAQSRQTLDDARV